MNILSMFKTSAVPHPGTENKDELRRQRAIAQRAADAARSRVLDELSKSVLADLKRRPST